MISYHGLKSCIIILFCITVSAISDNVKAKDDSEKIIFPNDFLVSSHSNHHYHHGHHGEFPPGFQHSRQFHSGDPDFPSHQNVDQKNITTNTEETYWNSTSKYIPLDFINIINEHNVSDLLLNYIEDDDYYPMVTSRFGESSERNAASIPKAAGCSPEVQTIELKNSSDASILYIPQCTKVERCNGCCSHPLLSCQPTKTETLTFKVLKTQYNGAKKLKLLGKEIILVEKHVACKCSCKIKEENCNKYQEYHPNECRCVCTNSDEEKKCYKNYNKKLWNPDLCTCQCRDIFQCSTGQYFDNRDCKCVTAPIRRRFATINSPDAPPIGDDEDVLT